MSGTFQDLFFSFTNSPGANHYADSDNIGRSQCRFNPTHLEEGKETGNISLLAQLRRREEKRKPLAETHHSYRSVSNQASWLLSIRSWVWPRSGSGSVWWPRSGRVSAW